jgi:RHS repeat-associated protein
MVEGDLYYYGARWYDPQIGRFIQPDTIVPSAQGTQAFDRYAYVNNNPLRYTDPSGRWMCDMYEPGCAQTTSEKLAYGVMYSKTYSQPFSYSFSGSYDFGINRTNTVDRYSDDLISPSLEGIKGPASVPIFIDFLVRILQEFQPQQTGPSEDDLYWTVHVTNYSDSISVDMIEFFSPKELIRLNSIEFFNANGISIGRKYYNQMINNNLQITSVGQFSFREIDGSGLPFGIQTGLSAGHVTRMDFNVTCLYCFGTLDSPHWTPTKPYSKPTDFILHIPY